MNNRNWPNIAKHSMTIGGKHTFRDWSMVPAEIPVFAPPAVKTTYIDVPAADGDLDYTEVLTDRVSYTDRSGSFSFIVLDDEKWATAYSNILAFLQGKKLNCILDDDPEWYYSGRFWVSEWKSNRSHNTIVIEYKVEPYALYIGSTAEHDWLWDELFDLTIYYGTFDVYGAKARNLINPSPTAITPKFTCSMPTTVTIDGNDYVLSQGITSAPGFALQPGNNYMTFSVGDGKEGRVLVDYAAERKL